uniref:AlNc14C222G9132 protein n=1 Tax=Albugo laibachii Nc14 TaxID=890382 RepID=F0WRY9_9STRA|nr:AlNc14C222G9132 [Albugo laibachii Nc14]|eukprot:CCA24106.1 AlNc14C222G9132 [Albugo laibachii Nc14]
MSELGLGALRKRSTYSCRALEGKKDVVHIANRAHPRKLLSRLRFFYKLSQQVTVDYYAISHISQNASNDANSNFT